MATQYPLTPGTLSSTCYPASAQTLYNEMFAKGFVTLDIEGVIISESSPSATNRDKLWIKINGSGFPTGHFKFQNGLWVWPHHVPLNDKRVYLFIGSSAEVNTLDDGNTNPVADADGPFWQIDTDFEDRIPIGVGSSLATSVGTNYGDADAKITLGETNIPEHFHYCFADETVVGYNNLNPTNQVADALGSEGSENYVMAQSTNEATLGKSGTYGQETPDELNVLNPVRAVYMIKRTARIYTVG